MWAFGLGRVRLCSAGQRHSVLYAQFVLRRHTGYFLINFYMPCSLLVVISWVGFWINREATADRITLGKYYRQSSCVLHISLGLTHTITQSLSIVISNVISLLLVHRLSPLPLFLYYISLFLYISSLYLLPLSLSPSLPLPLSLSLSLSLYLSLSLSLSLSLHPDGVICAALTPMSLCHRS